MAVVESELSLFEVYCKGVLCNPMELSESVLGVAPKRFNSIDMFGTSYEFIVAEINPEMLINANIRKSIVAPPSIRTNHAFGVDFATDNSLQRDFEDIGDDLGVDAVASFEKTKHNGLAASSVASFAPNAFKSEVRFIGLKLAYERQLGNTDFNHTSADALIDRTDNKKRQARAFSCISRSQIKREKPNKLAKLGFADFGTANTRFFQSFQEVSMY